MEDAACSIGAEYKGAKVGNLADISVFSLHPRKFITTGEGGLVTTNNSEWADWMQSYKHFGMGVQDSRLSTIFERIGTNYKLSNIQAAVGVAQMRHIDELLQKRREIAGRYHSELRGVPGISIPETTEGGAHSYQSCYVLAQERNRVMDQLKEASRPRSAPTPCTSIMPLTTIRIAESMTKWAGASMPSTTA